MSMSSDTSFSFVNRRSVSKMLVDDVVDRDWVEDSLEDAEIFVPKEFFNSKGFGFGFGR